jgi:hypothetical protein
MMNVVGLNMGYQLNLMKSRSLLYGLKLIAMQIWDNAVGYLQAAKDAIVASAIWTKTAALMANIAATVISIAKWVLLGAALVSIVPVIIALVAIYAVWTAAQWALNIAMGANPIGAVILAVVLLGSAIAGILGYWDELNAGVQSLTGGFFDMWDVLILISTLVVGPIALLALAGKKIYDNWSAIKDMFKSVGNTIIDMVNYVLPAINSMLSALNYIPGINIGPIGPIAAMATGGVLKSGSAVVGEGGSPEIIKHTAGGTVVTPLSAAGKKATAGAGLDNSALIAAIQENTTAVKTMIQSMKGGGGDIVLTVDEREFARAVGKINKEQNSVRFRYG